MDTTWQLIESSPPPLNEYVLIFAKGWAPTVAKIDKHRVLYPLWELAQTGSHAEDNTPDFDPTHWAPIPETPQ